MQAIGYSLLALLALAAPVSSVEVTANAGSIEWLRHNHMSLPAFASFFQQRFGQDSEHGDSHHNAWRKQASVYLNLLQSLGSGVPQNKQNETRMYIDEILKLLQTPAQDIYSEAVSESDDLGKRIYSAYDHLKTAEGKSKGAYDSAGNFNTKLAACYTKLHEIEDDHAYNCNDRAIPAACYRMNATRKHKFNVAPKRPYNCSFAYGSDVEKCSGDSSILYHDLTNARDRMTLAWEEWKLEKTSCDSSLKTHKDQCDATKTLLINKRGECKEDLIDSEDAMCTWREWIQKRVDSGLDLDEAQGKAPYLLPPKYKEWFDLNLIICMLRTFRDRYDMTFKEEDYPMCEAEVKKMKWVGDIDTMEKEEAALLNVSIFNDKSLRVTFMAGLAEYYSAQYFIQKNFLTYVPPSERRDFSEVSISLFTTPMAQATSTLFAEIPDKQLPKSCGGYKEMPVKPGQGEVGCSQDNMCKFYDTDAVGVSHSVSAMCELEVPRTSSTVAMKVCVAGLRETAITGPV